MPKIRQTIPFEYPDAEGNNYVLVKRLEYSDGSKSFRQSCWDSKKRQYVSYVGCMKNVSALPWKAADFRKASTIFWCEGEKKTVALSNIMKQHKPDICCSCKWGGSGNFPEELVPWFHGKNVVIFEDNDVPGKAYARRVARAIAETAKSIKIVSFPDKPEKYDIADWLDEREVTA